ncbi:hypothetical protein LINPERHAP1_LOCUS5970 [Linum perenne]
MISFSDEEILGFYRPWSKAVVVKVLEKDFTYPVIRRRLESLWARAGRIQVLDLANNFYLVRFSADEDYQRALFEGTWKMAEERIGNYIDRTIQLDLATWEGPRARYARVCVEVDLSCPLLGKYIIEDKVYFVEYESLENIYFTCGYHRHKEDRCPKVSLDAVKQSSEPEVVESSSADRDIGSWMTVKRRHFKASTNQAKSPPSQENSGSRFSTLVAEEPATDEHRPVKTDKKTAAPKMVDETSKMDDALQSVLEKALGSKAETSKKSNSKKNMGNSHNPLADVTNILVTTAHEVAKGKSGAEGLASDSDGLVSVPIIYENPVFQSALPKQKPKAKAKPSISSAKKPSKAHDGTKVKKFVSKKPDMSSSRSKALSSSTVGRKDGSFAGGRPPDPSS